MTRAAQADVELRRGYRWPDLGLRVEYHKAADEHLVLGGVSFRGPRFEGGQELRQTGASRQRRTSAQLEAARRRVGVGLDAALAAHAARERAVGAYDQGSVAAIADNQRRARRSFEAGQIGMVEHRSSRREVLDAEREYLDEQLEQALAVVDVEAAAGDSP
jgi:outer membrane protein, heavy metal efflux system